METVLQATAIMKSLRKNDVQRRWKESLRGQGEEEEQTEETSEKGGKPGEWSLTPREESGLRKWACWFC